MCEQCNKKLEAVYTTKEFLEDEAQRLNLSLTDLLVVVESLSHSLQEAINYAEEYAAQTLTPTFDDNKPVPVPDNIEKEFNVIIFPQKKGDIN